MARDQAEKGLKDEENARIESSQPYKQLVANRHRIKAGHASRSARQNLTADQRLEAYQALDEWFEQLIFLTHQR